MFREVHRGEIYYVDLSPVIGSEQGGIRPAVILQNNVGNLYAGTTIIAPTTTRIKNLLPTHVYIPPFTRGLDLDRGSIVLLEQVRTVSKLRLRECRGICPPEIMEQINRALKISLGLEGGE